MNVTPDTRRSRRDNTATLRKTSRGVSSLRPPRTGILFLIIPLLLLLATSAAVGINKLIDKDRSTLPTATTILTFAALSNSNSDQQIFEAIAEAAKTNQVNVYRFEEKISDQGRWRRLYVFPGNTETILKSTDGHWKGFDPTYKTELKPYTEAIKDGAIPPGEYLIDGSQEQGEKVVDTLKAKGVESIFIKLPSYFDLLVDDGGYITADALIMITSALTLIGGAVYAASRRWKTITIRKITGWSATKAVTWDYLTTLAWAVGIIFTFIALLTATMWLYNGAFLLHLALIPVLISAGIALALLLISQTFMLLVMSWFKYAQLLAGRLPLALISTVMILVQLLAFASAVSASSLTLYKKGDQAELAQIASHYENHYRVIVKDKILFPSSRTAEEEKNIGSYLNELGSNIETKTREFLEEAERRGILVVSALDTVTYDPEASKKDHYHLVNSLYLENFPVYRADGSRWQEDSSSKKHILAVSEGLSSEARQRAIEYAAKKLSVSKSELEIITLKPNQPLTAQREYLRRALFPTIEDPWPPKKDNHMIFSSSKDIFDSDSANIFTFTFFYRWAFFKDYKKLKELISDTGFTPYVGAIIIMSGTFGYTPRANDLYPMLALSIGSFIMASIVLSAVYLQRHRKRMYLQILFGKGFWYRHWRYPLTVTATGLTALVLLIGSGVLIVHHRLHLFLQMSIIPLIILAATVIIGLIYLSVQERRLGFETIKDG